MKGNQLVFTESGNIYRDQVGPIHEPAADKVISNESVNIIKGNNIEKKNENRFASYASIADSYKHVRILCISFEEQWWH